jgi:acid phosphatase type 7
MNNFSSHLLIFLFSIGSIQAKTDKYRLTLRGNPSNSIVVRWNQVSGNNATVYYVTKDYVTDFSKYKFTNKADRKVIYHAMNNHLARLKNLEGNTAYNFVIKDNKRNDQTILV